MTAVRRHRFVTIDEYLIREAASPIKHEYVNGVLYAMAGATNLHNSIAMNIVIALGSQLRGKPCQVFASDTKIRVANAKNSFFYYPDVMVVCEQNSDKDTFQDKPAAVFEVLSKSTRRVDEGEKQHVYLSLPSLDIYMLVEQEFPLVTVYRRTGSDFVPEEYQKLEDVIPLPEFGIVLALADVYNRVKFEEEPEEAPG